MTIKIAKIIEEQDDNIPSVEDHGAHQVVRHTHHLTHPPPEDIPVELPHDDAEDGTAGDGQLLVLILFNASSMTVE